MSIDPERDQTTGLEWRPMQADDLAGVVSIARIAFPSHFEGADCFQNRFALYPRGCFVLCETAKAQDGLCYQISYPCRLGQAPALNTVLEGLPVDPDLLYLHDLALDPRARGRGLTRPIVERLADQASQDGWSAIALVAVNQAGDFWNGLGFYPQNPPKMAEKLASYGDGAVYM
ncbi:hypothetical protein LTR94_025857, partial [Friedmanniomyces endolithicus]